MKSLTFGTRLTIEGWVDSRSLALGVAGRLSEYTLLIVLHLAVVHVSLNWMRGPFTFHQKGFGL